MTRSSAHKILFVVENVTAAQVSQLVALANCLPRERFEVLVACADFDQIAFAHTTFKRLAIGSLPRQLQLEAMAAGRPPYGTPVLEHYLEEELGLLRTVRPSAVVANFRPSLTVSAPLARIPLVTVVSAHWSPWAVRSGFPVPDHPMVKLVGLEVARRLLPKALPSALALFAKPINALRKKHGLRPLSDLLEVMTWGELTLYPDLPDLAPVRNAPSSHYHIGPVHWSAPVALPSWWDELDPTRPAVYMTLGSSGNLDAWPALQQGLSGLAVNVMLATSGRIATGGLPRNFWPAELLPGALAARRSELVITNGGAGSSYQALAEGKPVIGIASNLDQHLTMTAIDKWGAGRLLRADQVTADQLRQAVVELLHSSEHANSAARLSARLADWSAPERFTELIEGAARAWARRSPP